MLKSIYQLFSNKQNVDLNKMDINKMVSEISDFLIDDSKSDSSTPFKEYLLIKQLDYSVDSLRFVDDYLDKVRIKRKSLTKEQHTKIIARCGAYCGEVIRRNSLKSYIWITYDYAAKVSKFVKNMGESIFIKFILHDEKTDDFLFPLAKVQKFLENGREDSLQGLAWIVIKKK